MSTKRLAELRDGVEAKAKSYGYPDPVRSKSDFDADVGEYLAETWKMPFPDGLHSDCWSFLCLCVLPHVVAWRFELRSETDLTEDKGKRQRFVGGNRNALQRCWIRAVKLRDPDHESDPMWRVRGLREDTLVQIFERPGLSSEPAVAQAVADVALEQQKHVKSSECEALHRNAIKLMRARGAVRLLQFLPRDLLLALLRATWLQVGGAPEEVVEADHRFEALYEILVEEQIVVDRRDREGGSLWVYVTPVPDLEGWRWSSKRSGLFTTREGPRETLVRELFDRGAFEDYVGRRYDRGELRKR